MWTCPKCGREFRRTNQGHYCGKAPQTVSEYIELQDPQAYAHLTELRSIILECVPDLKERIAWSMPFFERGKCSVSFAACKKHISFYVDAKAIEEFKPQLNGFEIKKNAIYLPYNKALPVEVIQNIVMICFEEN